MAIDVTRWVWQLQGLTVHQKFLLVALADFADELGITYPSHGQLRHYTGEDRKTVIAGLAYLVKVGLLVDTGQRMGRTGRVVVYKIPYEYLPANSSKQGTIKAKPIVPSEEPLHIKAAEIIPDKGPLPVDNSSEIVPPNPPFDSAMIPPEAPLRPQTVPPKGPLAPETPFLIVPPFPPNSPVAGTGNSPVDGTWNHHRNTPLNPGDNLLTGARRIENVSQHGKNVVKRTKAALERERLAQRYAAIRERNEARSVALSSGVDIDHAGGLVQTDEGD